MVVAAPPVVALASSEVWLVKLRPPTKVVNATTQGRVPSVYAR